MNPLASIALLAAVLSTTACHSLDPADVPAPGYVRVSVTVVSFEPAGMVLSMTNFDGVGCGSIEDAAMATVRVLAPQKYAGREYGVRLSAFGSEAPVAADAPLRQAGATVTLEIRRELVHNSPKQVLDLPEGDAHVVIPDSQSPSPPPSSELARPITPK